MKLKVTRADVWVAWVRGRPGRLAVAIGKRLIPHLALDTEDDAAGGGYTRIGGLYDY